MDIGQIIRDRALANGVDPAVLAQIAKIESSNNPNSTNGSSSAKGLFGFTDGTYAKYGAPGTSALDPVAASDAGAKLLKANGSGLASAGLETSPGALYLAHFAGLGGARKLLNADPAAPVSAVLDPAAIKANPFLAQMSVSDLKNWAGGKMGAAPAPSPQAAPPSPPTGMLDTPAASPAMPSNDGTGQALASLQSFVGQPQAEPPPLQPIQMPMPQRRIDPAMLQRMLSAPLMRGFS